MDNFDAGSVDGDGVETDSVAGDGVNAASVDTDSVAGGSVDTDSVAGGSVDSSLEEGLGGLLVADSDLNSVDEALQALDAGDLERAETLAARLAGIDASEARS